MGWVWLAILILSILGAALTGNGSALASAIPKGAQAGVTLAVSLAGSMCLWTGLGRLMEKIGATGWLSRFFAPVLGRIFPTFRKNSTFSGYLSANVCANFLGLGNAATPMGIQAARCLAEGKSSTATDELCRLIILNTASIQAIPATVAAVRSQLGSVSPFDILPAVWITSLCAAGVGLSAAWVMGKLWKH